MLSFLLQEVDAFMGVMSPWHGGVQAIVAERALSGGGQLAQWSLHS